MDSHECPNALTPINDKCPPRFPKLYVYRKGDKIYKCCQKDKVMIKSTKKREQDCNAINLEYMEYYAIDENIQRSPVTLHNMLKMSYANLFIEGNLRCINPGPRNQSISVNKILDGLASEIPTESWMMEQNYYISQLSKKEKDYIALYTYHGDRILNAFLRQDYTLSDSNIKYIAQNIDSFKSTLQNFNYIEEWLIDFYNTISRIIQNAPVSQHRLILWRGQDNYDNFSRGTVNRIYQNKGMLSTSMFAYIAYSGFTKGNNPHMVRIIVPKGTPCLFMESETMVPGEYEILFNHGSAYYVLNDIHEMKKILNKLDTVRNIDYEPGCDEYVRVRKPTLSKYTTNSVLLVKTKSNSKHNIKPSGKLHLTSSILK